MTTSSAAQNRATAARSGSTFPAAALALLVTVQFLLVLDGTIVGVALPSLAKDVGFAQENLSWVTNAYLLLFGGFLMLGGRLADLVGRRRLFIGSLLLLVVASVFGGLASNPTEIIIVRAVQGLASAFAAPAALSLLMTLFPDTTPEEQANRGKALGVYGAVSGAGSAGGLILGGLLTAWIGWQAVFFVNVPIALVAALLAFRLLPGSPGLGWGESFDLAGALLITSGLGLIVFVLVRTEQVGWLSLPTLGLGAVALLLLASFVAVESRAPHPLIPLAIFRRRALRAANLIGALTPMAVIPAVFFVTLYTQQVQGYSPIKSGLALVPLALCVVLGATFAGKLAARIGLRWTTALGTLFVAVGMLWLSRIDGGSFAVEQLVPEMVVGLGGGTVWVMATGAATASASPEEAGLASGLFNTSNQIGAVLGLAILASVANSATERATAAGHSTGEALTSGYQATLLGAVVFAVLAVGIAVTQLPDHPALEAPAPEAAPERATDGHPVIEQAG